MLTKERAALERQAQAIVNSLSPDERWRLQDDLVLGCFDWMDWFNEPPKRGTMTIVSNMLQLWEETRC